MRKDNTYSGKDWGELFGYPSCCISVFVARMTIGQPADLPEDKPFYGTGYVPCHSCRGKAPGMLVEEINQRRDPKLPPFAARKGYLAS